MGGGNKFSIGLNSDSDLELYNRATGAAQITLPIGGGVSLADSCVAITQSEDDNSTKVATTAYVDNQVSENSGGGGETCTFLSQQSDASLSSFSGIRKDATPTLVKRQLLTTETNVLVFSDHNSGSIGHFAVTLPLISTVLNSKITIRNMAMYQNLYVYLHANESNTTFMRAWSSSTQLESSPLQVSTSWRKVEFFAYRDLNDVDRYFITFHKT